MSKMKSAISRTEPLTVRRHIHRTFSVRSPLTFPTVGMFVNIFVKNIKSYYFKIPFQKQTLYCASVAVYAAEWIDIANPSFVWGFL